MEMKTNKNYQILNRIECNDFDLTEDTYISHTIIETVDFRFYSFKHHVHIDGCVIENLLIHSTFFEGGFTLENCIIMNDINYEMGGHNKSPFIICNNIFHNVLQFFDCIFDAELMIKNNVFCKGASLYNNTNYFPQSTKIIDNIGDLNLYVNLG